MEGLADRREEMRRVISALEQDGFSLVVVEGPEGVGKTTLLRELKRVKGGMWHSCSESDAPFQGIRELLKSVGREDVLSSAYGTVLSVYGIHRATGILLAEVSRRGDLDGDVFAGMLTAVQAFVRDSLSMLDSEQEGYLSSLEYGDYRIVVARGSMIDLVAIVKGMEEYALKSELLRTLREFEEAHGSLLENWDGNVSRIPMKPYLEKFLESGREGEIMLTSAIDGFMAILKEFPVIIDDVHWLDARSREFLRLLLVKSAGEDAGKFVISVNSEFPIPEEVEAFLGDPRCTTVYLGNLDEKNVVEFLDFHYPDNLFSKAFFEDIRRCTGGNPLRILNLMEKLRREGLVYEQDGFWHGTGVNCEDSTISLPEIPGDERELLETAAAMGFITLDFLTEVLEVKKLKAFKFLRRVEKMGIMERRGDVYVFTHESIRNEVLKRASHVPEDVLEVAAEYYLEKGEKNKAALILERIDPERAAELYGEMAKESVQNSRLREAAARYAKAYSLSGNKEYALKAGRLYMTIGEYGKAAGMFEKVMDVPEGLEGYVTARAFMGEETETGDEFLKHKAQAIIKYLRGDFKGALEHARVALRIKEDFELLVIAGDSAMTLGEEYKGYFEKARESVRDTADRLILMRKELGELIQRGHLDDVLYRIDDAIELARSAGSWKEVAALLNLKANALIAKGRKEEGLMTFFQALRYAEMVGDPNLTSILLGNIGIEFMNKGEYEKALKYQMKVLRIFQAASNRHGVAFTKLDMGQSYLGMGEWGLAKRYLSEALEELRKVGDVTTELYTEFHLLAAEFVQSFDCETGRKMREIYGRYRDMEDLLGLMALALIQALVDRICGWKSAAIDDMREHRELLTEFGRDILDLLEKNRSDVKIKNALLRELIERAGIQEKDNIGKK